MATSAATLLFSAVAVLVPAGPAYAATWSVIPTPNASTGANVFTGVDARSTTDVWAVGHADHSPVQPFQRPLTVHWNGSTWALVSTPALSDAGYLKGVDGSSASNVWAVGMKAVPAGGGTIGAAPLTERWDGAAWTVVPGPVPAGGTGASLEGVKTFSATSAWAVGNYTASTAPHARTLIERWDGASWTVVPSPSPDPTVNLLSDVDGVAPDDVWATGNIGSDGYGGTIAGIVLHWNGSTWSQVAVPGTTSDGTLNVPVLEDVVALASNDVWIVGRAFHFGLFRFVPIHIHWNGVNWQRGFIPNAPSGGFTSVTAVSPTKVYAIGNVIAKWNGSAWTLDSTTIPSALIDATAIGSGTVWAAGYRYDPAVAQIRTLAFRGTDGT